MARLPLANERLHVHPRRASALHDEAHVERRRPCDCHGPADVHREILRAGTAAPYAYVEILSSRLPRPPSRSRECSPTQASGQERHHDLKPPGQAGSRCRSANHHTDPRSHGLLTHRTTCNMRIALFAVRRRAPDSSAMRFADVLTVLARARGDDLTHDRRGLHAQPTCGLLDQSR